jgi:urea transporter
MKLNSNTRTGSAILILLALVIVVVVFAPLVTIWAANTLFNLTIPFSLETWFATLVIGTFLRGENILSFKK